MSFYHRKERRCKAEDSCAGYNRSERVRFGYTRCGSIVLLLMIVSLLSFSMVGCGNSDASEETETADTDATTATEATEASDEEDSADAASVTELEDGVYTVDFQTDSSMFHVNEAYDGKGTLTVENGEMTVHVALVSKNIVNVFYGTAEEAQEEGAELIEPTIDTVTYSDGYTEEVYGFDIPVPALDEEYNVAIIGTKDKWYDHTVSVSNPVAEE